MKIKNILIALVLVSLLAGASYFFMNSDGSQLSGSIKKKDKEYDVGYKAGKDIGYKVGYKEGKAAGYDTGYEEGQAAGYEEGQAAGYEEGQAAGYEEGQAAGYEEGQAAIYDGGGEVGRGEAICEPEAQSDWDVGYWEGYETCQNEYNQPQVLPQQPEEEQVVEEQDNADGDELQGEAL